jgi:hypothetical protein
VATETAWAAKLSRAQRHVDSLRDVVAAYVAEQPVVLVPEATDDSAVTAYRVKYGAPIPAEVALVCGDALHNIRSALDSLVFAMVCSSAGRPLTQPEKKASYFPMSKDSAKFDSTVRDSLALRLLAEPAVEALRVHQPWYLTERGVEGLTRDELATVRRRDVADWWVSRLAALSNIDKHRRLTMAAWWPDLLYWTSSGDTRRHLRLGDGTVEDGSVLCYMVGHDPAGSDLRSEFVLVLADDPAHKPTSREYSPRSCVNLLQAWCTNAQHLVHAVEGRLADGPV